jgi:hypothetical protein
VVKVAASTETREAPRRQGATTENIEPIFEEGATPPTGMHRGANAVATFHHGLLGETYQSSAHRVDRVRHKWVCRVGARSESDATRQLSERVVESDDGRDAASEAGVGQGKQHARRDEPVAGGVELEPGGAQHEVQVTRPGIELFELRRLD